MAKYYTTQDVIKLTGRRRAQVEAYAELHVSRLGDSRNSPFLWTQRDIDKYQKTLAERG